MDPLENQNTSNEHRLPPEENSDERHIDVDGAYVEQNHGTTNQGETIVGRDINIIGFQDSKSSTGSQCPSCGTNAEGYGRNVCTNCNSVFYARNPDNYVAIHKTLSPEESTKYVRLISGIKVAIRSKDYDTAWGYCQEITNVNLGIQEPESWIHTAMCSYLKTANNEIIRTEAMDILNYLATAYEKAKEVFPNVESDEYKEAVKAIQETAATISTQLFYIIRSRLRYLGQPQMDESTNRPFWSVSDRKWIIQCIGAFQACFNIYPEEKMPLVEVVKELSVERKWIIKSADGNLSNVSFPNSCLPSGYRKFDATRKREELIQIIRSIDSNYEPEALFMEPRFVIENIDTQQNITPTFRIGNQTVTPRSEGFRIIEPPRTGNKRFLIQPNSEESRPINFGLNQQVNPEEEILHSLDSSQLGTVQPSNSQPQRQISPIDAALERTRLNLNQSLTNNDRRMDRGVNPQRNSNGISQILDEAFDRTTRSGKALRIITLTLFLLIVILLFSRVV